MRRSVPFIVNRHPVFEAWHASLKDRRASNAIDRRVARLELGLLGDTKAVGDGVSELRIDYGPGYRIYFVQRGATLLLLLCGGDKSTQRSDISRAKALTNELDDEGE